MGQSESAGARGVLILERVGWNTEYWYTAE